MNRPDAGPQPQHAIDRDGDDWTDPDRQVVSGPFRQLEHGDARLVLVRNDYTGARPGNVARVEITRATADEAAGALERGELDLVRVMYTPRTSDHVRSQDRGQGPLTWTAYLGFATRTRAGRPRLRLALAYAIDRAALEQLMPANLEVATGGLVPPALQGHTPDIVLPFDPDRAREHLRYAGVSGELGIVAQDVWESSSTRSPARGARFSASRSRCRSGRPRTSTRSRRSGGRSSSRRSLCSAGFPGIPIPSTACASSCTRTRRPTRDGYAYPPFDVLIDSARHAETGAKRLELYRQADRLAVAEQAAVVPLVYGRSMAFVRPGVEGWWEFAKSSASFADLDVD